MDRVHWQGEQLRQAMRQNSCEKRKFFFMLLLCSLHTLCAQFPESVSCADPIRDSSGARGGSGNMKPASIAGKQR